MMSSETSTDVQGIAPAPSAERPADAGFKPWQLFTLAGLLGAAVVAFRAGGEPHAVRIALILTVFAAAAVGLGLLRVLLPLTGSLRMRSPEMIGGRTRAALEREKTLALRSIKELQFDYAMGKISDKDFQEMSLRLRTRAARMLRQLDAGSGYREEIEREIARRVSTPTLARTTTVEETLVDAPEDQADQPAPETAPAVPATCGCGTANDPDARFCKACGARMEAA